MHMWVLVYMHHAHVCSHMHEQTYAGTCVCEYMHKLTPACIRTRAGTHVCTYMHCTYVCVQA